MTSNQIAYWANQERVRSNLAQEAEMKRHNLEQEKIGFAQAGASYLGAQAAYLNAGTNAAMLSETRRHNEALEGINQYTAETGRFQSVASTLLGAYDSETKRKDVEIKEEKLPYEKFGMAAKGIGDLFKPVSGLVDLLVPGGKK